MKAPTYEEFMECCTKHDLWLLDTSELMAIVHNNKHLSNREAWVLCFSSHMVLDKRSPEMNLQRIRDKARDLLIGHSKGLTQRDVLLVCRRLEIGYKNMPTDKHTDDLVLAKKVKEKFEEINYV